MPFNSATAALAGSRSKRGLADRTRLLNDLFDPEKATRVFRRLQNKALDGDIEAMKLYLAYCFGKPKESLDITSDGEKVSGYTIEIIRTHAQLEIAN